MKTVQRRHDDGERNFAEEDLSRANLYGAYLRKAYLRKADLSGANLGRTDLGETDLRGADLYGADLTGADLTGADLTGADLTGADLTGADLTGADLTGADLTGVYLSGANLSGANLSETDLKGAFYTPVHILMQANWGEVGKLCAEMMAHDRELSVTVVEEDFQHWSKSAGHDYCPFRTEQRALIFCEDKERYSPDPPKLTLPQLFLALCEMKGILT